MKISAHILEIIRQRGIVTGIQFDIWLGELEKFGRIEKTETKINGERVLGWQIKQLEQQPEQQPSGSE